MSHRRVLVVWEHGGNLGHIARLLPIVSALLHLGHAVTLAVRNPESVRSYAPEGVRIIQVPRAQSHFVPSRRVLGLSDVWLNLGFEDPAFACQCVEDWKRFLHMEAPSCVLIDASPFAIIAANTLGIPSVAIGNGYELFPNQSELSLTPWMEQAGVLPSVQLAAHRRLTAEGELILKDAVGQLALSLGLHAVGSDGDYWHTLWGKTERALVIWPEVDHFDRVKSSDHFVGPIWLDVQGAEPVPWPQKPGPKVLCYVRRVERYGAFWKALQQLGANVLVLAPGEDPSTHQAALLCGMAVHANTVQCEALIPSCDAVVTEGGSGLTCAALTNSKPLLLLPTQMEQSLLAYQLCRRQLALSSLSFGDAAQMGLRVEQLLSQDTAKNVARRFGTQHHAYRPQDAVDKVVDLLVGHVSGAETAQISAEVAIQ